MNAPRSVPSLSSGPRAWLAPAALSVAVHLAALGGALALKGLVTPPVPLALVPVELAFEAAPAAAPARLPSEPAMAAPPRSVRASSSTAAPPKSVPQDPAKAETAPAEPLKETGEAMSPPDPSPPPAAEQAELPPPPPQAKPDPPREVVPPPVPRAKPEPPVEARQVVRSLAEGAAAKAPPAESDASPVPQSASLPADTAPAAMPSEAAPAPPKLTAPGYGNAALGNPPPRYPDSARRRGQHGSVVLRVRVDAKGAAEGVEVLDSSGHKLLDEAARRAVARWRFTPATLAGIRVSGSVDIPVTFRLRD